MIGTFDALTVCMTYLTIAQVKLGVYAYGMTFRYQKEYDEFRIDYPRTDKRWNEDTAYFTPYRDDAILTAKMMSEAN